MYVAACAFDKTVNLFDFFSGDLVAQVSGHSELITSVRFSPDGRFLLSVGGDGCVMMWGMAEPLVAAMQERLLELFSSAQTRQLQVVIPTDGGHSSKTSPKGSPVSVRPPPPPSYQAAIAVPPAVVSSEKVEVRKVADSVGASVASGRGSRWASRVDPQGGYELFGRKMGNNSAQKMKLTLEPSSFRDMGGISHDSVEAEKGHVVKGDYKPEELSECDMNDDSLEGRESAYIGNKLANTLEAGDDVMGFKDPDETYADSPPKKSPRDKHRVSPRTSPRTSPRASPRKHGGHTEDFDKDGDESGSEAYLAKATSKIDTLEQSASHLESWLESMVCISVCHFVVGYSVSVRECVSISQLMCLNCYVSSGVSLSPIATNASPQYSMHQIRNGNGTSNGALGAKDSKAREQDVIVAAVDQSSLLSNSLSSLFFKNLQVSKGDRIDERLRSEVTDNLDEDLPPPPRHTAKDRSREKEVEKGREKDSVSEMPVHRGVDDLDASVLTMDSMTAPSLPPSSSSSVCDTMDSRRKETAAAVAQMKSKLRNMGMLGVTGEVGRKIDRSKQTSRSEETGGQFASGTQDPILTKSIAVPTAMTDAQPKLSFAAVDESNLPSTPPLISELGNVTNRSRSRSRSVSPKRKGVPIPVFKDSDDDEADDEDYGSIQGTIAFGAAIDCNASRSSKGSTPVKEVLEDPNMQTETDELSVDVKVERISSSPPLPPICGKEEQELCISSSVPSPVGVAITGFPPSSTSSSAASSPRKKGSGADAALKMDEEEDRQEKALRDKIQEQEEKLRLKAAQCKQIIRCSMQTVHDN
jgi:WD domain, G-beta repeat